MTEKKWYHDRRELHKKREIIDNARLIEVRAVAHMLLDALLECNPDPIAAMGKANRDYWKWVREQKDRHG